MSEAPSLAGKARALTVVYGTILIVLAVIPRFEGTGVGVSDCILHALAYGVFGGLLLFSNLRPAGEDSWIGAVMAVGGATAFGLGTEFLQMLIPYRSFETLDVVADSVGAFLFVLILAVGVKAARVHGRSVS